MIKLSKLSEGVIMSRPLVRLVEEDDLDMRGRLTRWTGIKMYTMNEIKRGQIRVNSWVETLDTVLLVRDPREHDPMSVDALVITVHGSLATKNPKLTVEVEGGEQFRVTWISALGVAIDELF